MLTSPAGLCRPCRLAGPAHAAATAGFSIQEGEIPRETDCLLEGAGFEPSVPPKMGDAFEIAFFTAIETDSLTRGTEGSNPAPSAGESAELPSTGGCQAPRELRPLHQRQAIHDDIGASTTFAAARHNSRVSNFSITRCAPAQGETDGSDLSSAGESVLTGAQPCDELRTRLGGSLRRPRSRLSISGSRSTIKEKVKSGLQTSDSPAYGAFRPLATRLRGNAVCPEAELVLPSRFKLTGGEKGVPARAQPKPGLGHPGHLATGTPCSSCICGMCPACARTRSSHARMPERDARSKPPSAAVCV